MSDGLRCCGAILTDAIYRALPFAADDERLGTSRIHVGLRSSRRDQHTFDVALGRAERNFWGRQPLHCAQRSEPCVVVVVVGGQLEIEPRRLV